MSIPAAVTAPGRVLFGAAYYPEYHPSGGVDMGQVARDLDLMVRAHFTVIRVGESVWSTWEPRNGVFELDWLSPVLDAAHDRGLAVVLGTPTYAVPPWLQVAYPEVAGERSTGERIAWGARQEVDYTHPAFRFHAERVIRAVVARYADHPAVIGFQVDNEPGLELFHNQGVFAGFVQWLQDAYGDVDALNREWGLTYWSHRLTDWSQLWRPDGNTFPQYDLAWRRYQAELTTQFIGWQRDVVAEYRRSGQFITTCLQYPRRGIDDRALAQDLDVVAGNPYYGMQDHLDPAVELDAPNYWTTTGVAGLLRQGDRMFSSGQRRFLVTETNAQAIGPAEHNLPPWPGQLKQAAFALVARGAAMVEYWHWQTLPYGAETYWGGVLPHSGVPGRVYRELTDVGADLAALGTALDGYDPDADVALLWSNPSRYALQFMPPFPGGTGPDEESYERIVDAFHRGVVDSGRQVRILHVEQALQLGARQLAARFPVLVAAGLYIADDSQLDLLVDYAAAGGHLVLGPRTAYADEEARARVAVAPARLRGAAGASYEEFSNLARPVPVRTDAWLPMPATATATTWLDGLEPDADAEVLARYDHPHFGSFAAVVSHAHGTGRVTTVGCLPDPVLARAVIDWAAEEPITASLLADLPSPVTASSGRLADGRRAVFVFNWGWDVRDVVVHADATDAVTGEPVPADHKISLDGWSVRTLFISR